MTKKKVYLTTPAYYPSANPHIGNAYASVLVDTFNRFFKLAGYETHFLTGTDEHGSKIAKNAKAMGVTPLEFVDPIVARFKELWKILSVDYDDYIRTSEERHKQVVQKVFSQFVKTDDVYLEQYEGWYCVFCEAFWSETQVGSEHLCPDCGRPVSKEKEETYFFNTQKYLPKLLEMYDENPEFILPLMRKNEMLNSFIKPGLENLSVTRTTLDWGVRVLENPKHVVYVWLDALLNYLSALGYLSDDDSLFQKFWSDPHTRIIHFVGADINRFHTIYWPMFLDALQLRNPNQVFVHGLLMTKEGKMSKSKGNVISPLPLVDLYGVDPLRFYLTREIQCGENGQFMPEQYIESINRDLVNNFGNLLNRSLTMINKYCEGIIPSLIVDGDPVNAQLRTEIADTIKTYEKLFAELNSSAAIMLAFELSDKGNKYIEVKEPWVLFKDSANKKVLDNTMAHLAYLLLVVNTLLSPVIVNSAPKVFTQLGLQIKEPSLAMLEDLQILSGAKINKGDVLFPRLDLNKEPDIIREIMQRKD